MIKVGLVGATGYAGQQLLWILEKHKEVEIIFLSSNSYEGKDISEVYKNYKNYYSKKLISQKDVETKLGEIDLLFVALPHGMSETLAYKALGKNVKVIDLGADFRLDDSDTYENWYNVVHEYPEINKQAVYGQPELYRKEIKESNIIAAPGCYPTSAILGTAPLLKNNLVNTKSIIIDSKSGVSGAGRGLKVDSLFTEVNENFKAYNLFMHRHTPEIEQELGKAASSDVSVIFTPHLLPINRGILSTIYLDLNKKITEEEVYKLYNEFYKNDYFVRITEELPEIKNIKNTNICEIGLRVHEEKNKIIIVSTIDNLIKGAGGQAVQAMNIMFGIDEKEGLEYLSMYI
ncbi:MAG: N-acetyl-gamma-glutamyl-phosphate reductase [Sebaldella sp.]|nr:N-acetyl-gamma-glutamyl-phosphate reductase [Sebaldella sp.]